MRVGNNLCVYAYANNHIYLTNKKQKPTHTLNIYERNATF